MIIGEMTQKRRGSNLLEVIYRVTTTFRIYWPTFCFLILANFLQAQALANPFAYESYLEQRKQLKLEAERASRITVSSMLLSFINLFVHIFLTTFHL